MAFTEQVAKQRAKNNPVKKTFTTPTFMVKEEFGHNSYDGFNSLDEAIVFAKEKEKEENHSDIYIIICEIPDAVGNKVVIKYDMWGEAFECDIVG